MAGILRVRDKDGVIREIPAFQSGVPFTRTVNGYPLSADVALSAVDVGALPVGFGNYGETVPYFGEMENEAALEAALDEVFSEMVNGEIRRVSFWIKSIGKWTWVGMLFKSSASYAILEVSSGFGNHVSNLKKTLDNNTWTPMEWENPPMQAGVEYRTTARYKGKAVYRKLVTYTHSGTLGDNSGKVDTSIPHGITGLTECLRCCTAVNGNALLPWVGAAGGLTIVNGFGDSTIGLRVYKSSWDGPTFAFDLSYIKD